MQTIPGIVSPARDQASSQLPPLSADDDNVVSDSDSQDGKSSDDDNESIDDLSAHDLEFISQHLLEALVPDDSLFLPSIPVDPLPFAEVGM